MATSMWPTPEPRATEEEAAASAELRRKLITEVASVLLVLVGFVALSAGLAVRYGWSMVGIVVGALVVAAGAALGVG